MYASCLSTLETSNASAGTPQPDVIPMTVVHEQLGSISSESIGAKMSLLRMRRLVEEAGGKLALKQYKQVIDQLTPLAFPGRVRIPNTGALTLTASTDDTGHCVTSLFSPCVTLHRRQRTPQCCT